MSYHSIHQCTEDVVLQERVTSGAMKEAYAGGDEFSQSNFGFQLQRNPALALNYFMWPTAIDYENEYAYAVDSGNPDPGGDVGVISDANIQAVVQLRWPKEQVVEPQPPLFPQEVTS